MTNIYKASFLIIMTVYAFIACNGRFLADIYPSEYCHSLINICANDRHILPDLQRGRGANNCSYGLNIYDDEKRWNKIADYKSEIRIDNINIAFHINENRYYDPANRLGREKGDLIMGYLIKNKYYEFYRLPVLSREVVVEFIKKYQFFYIEGTRKYSDALSPIELPHVLVIPKKGDDVYFIGLDVELFNKIIKMEEIKVNNQSLAVDICMLFILIGEDIFAEIIADPKELEKTKENRVRQEDILRIKERVQFPIYSETDHTYELIFYTNSKHYFNPMKWQFEVNKENGYIKLLKREYIEDEAQGLVLAITP